MSKFVLTAQLQLQAPRNSQQVLKQVQSQLRGVNIPVELKAGKQVQRQLQGITKDAQRATSAAESLGRSFGLAVKRFAAFTVASRAVSLFTNSLASAVDEAIAFQREVVKIAQVTGKTVGQLKSLEKTITSLSVNLGVSSRELLSVGRILSQAGIKAKDLEVALSSLAKTTLAPTFENIEKTAEGAVAILAQFGEGVGALERQLGAINAVAGQFAVESGDLISAVRRFGGVFKSAGGSLEELLGLFTSVRATTRESSESIATGLRTIFTRIQRPRTIAFLKQFGVELLDVNGKFVGPLKAVEQLNKAFADLPQGDVRFIRIAEELGGFRQIGKVIPLIQQFETAERARQAAVDGGNSLTKDAATAQQALAVQITKVKEEFLALVRGIANDTTFQLFTRSALALASALIKIADALKPLIPLIGAFAAFKFAKGLGGFGAGVGAAVKGLGRNQGGVIQKFARGGFVPGQGNRDTVPAMLTPGEFVIKKSSAQKLGAGTLQAMNQNRFAAGGVAKEKGVGAIVPDIISKDLKPKSGSISTEIDGKGGVLDANAGFGKTAKGSINFQLGFSETVSSKKGIKKLQDGLLPNSEIKKIAKSELGFGGSNSKSFTTLAEGVGETDRDTVFSILDKNAEIALTNSVKDFASYAGVKLPEKITEEPFKLTNAQKGNVFEDVVDSLNGQPVGAEVKEDNRPFDFTKGVNTGNLFKAVQEAQLKYIDAKISGGSKNIGPAVFKNKTTNQLADDLINDPDFLRRLDEKRKELLAAQQQKNAKNSGGSIGGSGDTVPALLTPGEFVVNKKAAQSIGYGNLNSMNKTGVARFNKGGPVQMLNQGGAATGGGGALSLIALTTAAAGAQAAISKFGDKTDKASDQVAGWTIGLEKATSGFIQLAAIFIAVKALLSWTKALKDSKKEIETKEAKDSEKAEKELGKLDESKARKEEQKKNIEGKLETAKGETETAKRIQEASIGINKEEIADLEKKQSDQKFEVVSSETNLADAREKFNQDDLAGKRDRKRAEVEALRAEKASSGGSGLVGPDGKELSSFDDSKLEAAEQELQSLSNSAESAEQSLQQLENKLEQDRAALDKTSQAIEELENKNKKLATGTDEVIAAQQKETDLKRGLKAVTNDINTIDEKREVVLESLGRSSKQLQQAEKKKIDTDSKLKRGVLATGRATKRAAVGTARWIAETKAYQLSAKLASTSTRLLIKGVKGVADVTLRLGRGLNRIQKEWVNLGGVLRKAARGAKKLADAAKGIGGRAVRGAKAGFSKVGGGLAVGGGIAASVLSVGQQIASGFAEFFRRQERIAIASENSARAISAAGKAAQSENFGRAFSLEGIVRGLTDPAGLANEFADNIARSQAEAGFAVAQSTARTDQRRLKQGNFTTGEGADAQTDFAAAGSRTIAAQNRARQEFGALSAAEREGKEAEFAAAGTDLITSFANSGASLAELERTADGLAGLNQDQRKQYQILIKTLIATREAQKAVNKANFDSLKITSAFGAAAAAVNNFAAGLETGSNSLAGYVSELEAAQQGVGIDASGAIDAIEQELVASAQGAGAGSLVSSLQGQANVARATNQFGVGAAGAIEGLELSTDTETAKGQLEAALLSAIPEDADEATKKKLRQQIEAQVAGIENIQTADLSAVVKGVVDAGGKLSAGFQQAAKLQAQHNQVMIGLYKKQEELEAKAAEAKNKAIDTQLEAAKIFEDFGGSKLTGEAKLGARVAQFNNIGGLGGLGAQLTSGSAGDIRQAQGKINQTFFDQTDQFKVNAAARSVAGGGPGAFAGAQGIQDDKREEAKKANAALITFTKQRIALLKEELSIVQKKNAEEKSALDKLISGDVEGFLEGQAAAGAGAALRSGDASLAGLFGTSALGAGFKSLEGQGLSDQQLRSAEDLTLQRFGIQSTGVLSGTTSEEQALKGQGRELAGVLGDLAGDQAAFAQAEFTVQEAVINATNATFQNKLREVAEQNKTTTGGQSDVAGFFRGGPVYANRGMFVPRGTDTVPAMLTPGEFVVNRAAVQRGNNIQILRAMNSGGGASGQSKMRGGGVVRYYQDGGSVAPAISPEGITQLQGVFTQFAESVDKLVNSQFSVKLDTTNVNVNFNGASFLSTLKDDIKSELLETVKAEIGKAKPNNSGDIKTGNTVLGN